MARKRKSSDATEDDDFEGAESLPAVTYQLIQLYERWVVEHQHVARREAEMARLLERFEKQLQILERLYQTLPDRVQASGQAVATHLAEQSREAIKSYLEKNLEQVALTLNRSVTQAERTLNSYQAEMQAEPLKRWLMALLVAVGVGIVVGLVSAHWYKPSDELVRSVYQRR